MIPSISARNRSRRVFCPLFSHANPANVCCFATLVSTKSALIQYQREPRFPQHRRRRLVQSFPNTKWRERNGSRRAAGLQFGAPQGGSAAEPRLGGFCQLVRVVSQFCDLNGLLVRLPKGPLNRNAPGDEKLLNPGS